MKLPLPDTCLGCDLYAPDKGFSILEGDGSSGLMIIAESLGRAEEQDALPLRPRAPSGGVFQKALNISGLTQLRSTSTITNTIRCKAEAPYPAEAIKHCSQYLDQAVNERKPKLILCLGDVPLQALSPTPVVQSEVRGYVIPSRYGIQMIATMHPSRIARGDWPLFGVLAHDIRVAEKFARDGIPALLPTRYNLSPTIADVQHYLDQLLADPVLPAVYDIETAELIDANPKRPRQIIQMQFSSTIGEAIVVPYREPFIPLLKAIIATRNPKWDYNGRLFDRPILREHGFTLNGEFHDLMELYAHLQSGFVRSKDDQHGDKGVPSKLMSLQSCLSFWYPTFKPWKSVRFPKWDKRYDGQQLPLPVRLYGGRDVDASVRVGLKMFASLKRNGLEHGYRQHKWRLGVVLDDLSARGLPVDREAQESLRQYIASEEKRLSAELQAMIPPELFPTKSYKGLPRDLRAMLKEQGCKPKNGLATSFCERGVEVAMANSFEFRSNDSGDYVLHRILPFSANSPQQLLRYIVHQKLPVPRHIDTGQPTTGQAELEALLNIYDDAVLRHVLKSRKLTKLGGTYCSGDWTPGADGRVHGTFRFGTASGQISCTRPNIQQYPEHYNPADEWMADITKRVKNCIRAEPGHVFVKIDLRAYHAKVQAHLAGDPVYYRMADFDPHSYSTAHYVGEPDADHLMKLDDESLRRRLKEIKKTHAHERNFKIKRCTFLMQFGGGADKMFRILQGGFESVVEVQALMNLIKGLFPQTFVRFPEDTRRMLRQHPRIVTPFGACRWFWDEDAEQATAYRVSNCAHCMFQNRLINLYDAGVFSTFNLINYCHDSVWAMPLEKDADECIKVVTAELERPSKTLVSKELGAFWVHADSQIGYTMDKMEDTP